MSASQDTAPVLVPTDFSPDSQAALAWAAELSGWTGAPLLLLHVVHDLAHAPGYYARALKQAGLAQGGDAQLIRLEDAAAELLEEFVARMAALHPKLGAAHEVPTLLVTGVPATRILEVAENVGAQHIVMGSQGRTGLGLAMLGSKAEHVVRMASVPVTIVKAAPASGSS